MTSPGHRPASGIGAFLATAAGTALLGAFPFFGVALLAGGLVLLLTQGRRAGAVAAVLAGIVYSAIIAPGSAVFVAIASIALYTSVYALRIESTLPVAGRIAAAFSVAGIANAFAAAWMAGTTVDALLTESTSRIATAFSEANPDATTAMVDLLEEGAATAVAIWPSIHVVQGIGMAVVAILAVRWVAKRAGLDFPIPGFGEVDLPIHIVWPFATGLAFWALAKFGVPFSGLLDRAGMNLLVIARALLAVQGFAVITALADARSWGTAARALGALAALFLESVAWFVSGVGLIDMWMNFRRLPRGGAEDAVTEER